MPKRWKITAEVILTDPDGKKDKDRNVLHEYDVNEEDRAQRKFEKISKAMDGKD
jgi:hypothetical protein